MDKELLYIGSNGHVAAIDPETGTEAWRTSLRAAGADVTVMEHEGRVFAGCHGHLFCLDAETGKVLWKNGLKGMGFNDVTLAIGGQSIQFVATRSHA